MSRLETETLAYWANAHAARHADAFMVGIRAFDGLIALAAIGSTPRLRAAIVMHVEIATKARHYPNGLGFTHSAMIAAGCGL
ncbi:hypothetical protein [Nitrospirillum sp. BR 11163]|uniref:hypothetical protein n=1 Tax=Nitrospirillum sp. BR 11163 TaxID=3104323 RepID=UPI002B002808|nr:hypothetical protein [Nitrospirillum sp. BR 11163]MEA1674074.1 hypothetical protein [Nitrospirillum sp. BR 11163]